MYSIIIEFLWIEIHINMYRQQLLLLPVLIRWLLGQRLFIRARGGRAGASAPKINSSLITHKTTHRHKLQPTVLNNNRGQLVVAHAWGIIPLLARIFTPQRHSTDAREGHLTFCFFGLVAKYHCHFFVMTMEDDDVFGCFDWRLRLWPRT